MSEKPPTEDLVGATLGVFGAIFLVAGAAGVAGFPGALLAVGVILLLLAYMAF